LKRAQTACRRCCWARRCPEAGKIELQAAGSFKAHFYHEVEKENKGSSKEDVDVCSHAAILALRAERSFGMKSMDSLFYELDI
jgi:hypothetical protein